MLKYSDTAKITLLRMERITICRDSKTSSDASFNVDDDFHGYELLLLKRLQSDPAVCVEWREKLLKKVLDENYYIGVSSENSNS